jgi:hypothetical protein
MPGFLSEHCRFQFRSPDERSEIREELSGFAPDCATLHPGYAGSIPSFRARRGIRHAAPQTRNLVANWGIARAAPGFFAVKRC